ASATAPPRYPDFCAVARRAAGATRGASGDLGEVKKPLSLLEIGVDDFSQSIDRLIAGELLAVDKKGRRGIDPELLGGAVAHFLDAVEYMLIRQALVERLFGKS